MSMVTRKILSQQIIIIANQVYSSETPSAYQLVSFFVRYAQEHNHANFLDDPTLRKAVIIKASEDLTHVPKEQFIEKLETVFRSHYPTVYSLAEASSSKAISKDSLVEPPQLSKVHELCRKAGLSAAEIKECVVEISINGRSICFIFDSHDNLKQRTVIIEIIRCALRKQLATLQEAFVRGREHLCLTFKRLAETYDQGLLYGLETPESAARSSLALVVLDFNERADFISSILENPFLKDVVSQLAKKGDRAASMILKKLQEPRITIAEIAETISTKLSLGDWHVFLAALGEILFLGCPDTLQDSFFKMLKSNLATCLGVEDQDHYRELAEHFLAEFRKFRDPAYARMIYSLLPELPKGKTVVVTLGLNHREGVLEALKLLEQRGR
jgi:hypothetical protein